MGSKPKIPLSEKNFIQNGGSFFSFPFWLWIFFIAVFAVLMGGGKAWYDRRIAQEKTHSPFLAVTNRQFSIFLWQFSSFFRSQVSKKEGYLPDFLLQAENFNATKGEQWVSAPPDLLFLYHTWDRLLSLDFIPRPIPFEEFEEFLESLPEWQPDKWKHAPEGYVQLLKSPEYNELKDLASLSFLLLPLAVRQAFQGWKNYFKEGEQINQLLPTVEQVQIFLEQHPTYARSYWLNLVQTAGQPIAGESYLAFTLALPQDLTHVVPSEQLSSFLKVALFNAQQAMSHR